MFRIRQIEQQKLSSKDKQREYYANFIKMSRTIDYSSSGPTSNSQPSQQAAMAMEVYNFHSMDLANP